jgi:ribosome-binding factor A
MGNAEEKTATMDALTHASPFIRRQLTARLTIRRTPHIQFTLDETMEEAARLLDLMKHLPGTHPDA